MNILVALDDSTFARKALSSALALARLESSRVILLAVIPQLGAIDEVSPRMTEKLKSEAESLLAEASKTAEAADVQVESVLEQGVSPADNIITLAGERGIDLVILGHRGRSNLEKFLLGSVALRTVSHAPCSVMVVK